MIARYLRFLCYASCWIASATPDSSSAQDPDPADAGREAFRASEPPRSFLREDRRWVVEIPLWVPGYAGTFAYGDVSLEGEDGWEPSPENPIEPPDRNVFSRLVSTKGYLRFLFVGRGSYTSGRWHGELDLFGGKVGESLNFRYNDREIVQANFQTVLLRGFAAYAVYDWESHTGQRRCALAPYAGFRAHFLHVDSDLNTLINILDLEHAWGEAIIGLSNEFKMRRWAFLLRADYGRSPSFDSRSYMAQVIAYWRMSTLLSLRAGWTDWGVRVNRTVVRQPLSLDMRLSGPTLGLAFHF